MKKLTLKAFTLVEMLIVIVIIGILIAALMPRLQGAQGRARDIARQTALSNIGSAIVLYQGDHGTFPKGSDDDGVSSTKAIESDLINAGMSLVPTDPNPENIVKGLGSNEDGIGSGYFAYMKGTKNSVKNGGFVIMAHTETPGGSNWVVDSDSVSNTGKGRITTGHDLKYIELCREISLSGDVIMSSGGDGKCFYSSPEQLRYIYVY